VLKQISPPEVAAAPNASPRKTRPSSRAKIAVICIEPYTSAALHKMKIRGISVFSPALIRRRDSRSLILV